MDRHGQVTRRGDPNPFNELRDRNERLADMCMDAVHLAATATALGLSLVTRNRQITAAGVSTLW